MEYTSYVRKPFVVEALAITEDNLEEVAEFVGTIQTTQDGTRYILVDQRRIPNVTRVFPGFFMTRMGKNIRCYSKKVFLDQFTEMTDELATWVSYLNSSGDDEVAETVAEAS